MKVLPVTVLVFAFAAAWASASSATAQHACDPADEPGWQVMPSVEVADVTDGAPYRAGPDWVIDRTTRLLPLCNYFAPGGAYSLRSYSLDPYEKTERVTLCHDGKAVAPYSGACPPK